MQACCDIFSVVAGNKIIQGICTRWPLLGKLVLSQLHDKRTVLLASQRFSTMLRADRVIVLDEGKVVDVGSPAILRAPTTHFHVLFAEQFLTEKVFAITVNVPGVKPIILMVYQDSY